MVKFFIVVPYAKIMKINFIRTPFFSHGPSNSMRVKQYQPFIFLGIPRYPVFLNPRFLRIIRVLGHHEGPAMKHDP